MCDDTQLHIIHTCIHVIVVTWAQVIYLVCMPEAQGLRAYILGKSQVPMLQLMCNTSGTLKSTQNLLSLFLCHAISAVSYLFITKGLGWYYSVWSNWSLLILCRFATNFLSTSFDIAPAGLSKVDLRMSLMLYYWLLINENPWNLQKLIPRNFLAKQYLYKFRRANQYFKIYMLTNCKYSSLRPNSGGKMSLFVLCRKISVFSLFCPFCCNRKPLYKHYQI